MSAPTHSTQEAADRIGVSRNTLLRWLREGRLADVSRDWRGWRTWSDRDIERAAALKDEIHAPESDSDATPAEARDFAAFRRGLEDLGRELENRHGDTATL